MLDAFPELDARIKRAQGQDAWQILCLGLWFDRYQPTEIA